MTLTFSDCAGNAVRSVRAASQNQTATDAGGPALCTGRDEREADYEATGITAGANRFQWDLRYPDATEVTGFNPPIAAGGEEDEVSGPVVMPGTYTVTLDYGGSARRARRSTLPSIRAFTSIRARSPRDSRSSNAFTRRSMRSIARSTKRWRCAAA